jgi:hypothetical protein
VLRLVLVTVAALLVSSCDSACVCIYPPDAMFEGVVTWPDATPVTGATVTLRRSASGVCTDADGPAGTTTTAADGSYRLRAYNLSGTTCFWLQASAPSGSSIAESEAIQVIVEVQGSLAIPYPTVVPLQLAPPGA